jgi:hypothetical protein
MTTSSRIIAQNKKARYDYQILDTFEAGIVLLGSEVKSCRQGSMSLMDSYARIEKDEIYLVNAHISPYKFANQFNHEPLRKRKLLFHRLEIRKFHGGQKELLFFKDYVSRPILQEHLDGTEYTLDLLFDFNGELRCVVPRKRIEVRAGEVSKGMVDCEETVLDAGWKLGKKMKGARGCLNAQCFLSDDKTVKFVEINPRFGGGVPLSIHAGADFPKWIIEMNLGKDPGDISRAFKNNVLMLRYDDAVFVDG